MRQKLTSNAELSLEINNFRLLTTYETHAIDTLRDLTFLIQYPKIVSSFRMQQQQRNRSLKTAYFLWLVGGLFGWHHFYLERDIQGFLWLCFPGGFFGLGWLRDFWRMPDYVDQVNDEHHMLHAKKQLINPKPLFSPSRFLAQNLVGNSFAYLVIGSVPNADIYGYNLNVIGTTILVPLAIALGK